MGTGELIKQVKAMAPRERRKFLSAILALEEEMARPGTTRKPVKWPDVEERAKRIFGTRLLPNLVLLEREEETF